MPWLTIASIGMNMAPSILNAGRARETNKKIGEVTRQNVRLQKMETQMELRNLDQIQRDVVGEAKVNMAASGFAGGSVSNQTTLTSMENEFQSQRDWLKTTGAAKADILQMQGQLQQEGVKQQQTAAITSGITNSISTAGQMNNWWMPSPVSGGG